MEVIIILAIIIGVLIIVAIKIKVNDQNEGTKSEKVGKAIGDLAYGTANVVSNIAYEVTEPANKKDIRFAKEAIARRNFSIYHFHGDLNEQYKTKLFTVDEFLKRQLNFLNISEETWKRAAEKLLYLGILKHQAYNVHNEKYEKHYREHQIEEGTKTGGRFSHLFFPLIEALDFYKIPYQEWIDYGDVVIAMHNLLDDEDLEECGYI